MPWIVIYKTVFTHV